MQESTAVNGSNEMKAQHFRALRAEDENDEVKSAKHDLLNLTSLL